MHRHAPPPPATRRRGLALPFGDPLALSAGAGARLALAAAVLAPLWALVAWAMG